MAFETYRFNVQIDCDNDTIADMMFTEVDPDDQVTERSWSEATDFVSSTGGKICQIRLDSQVHGEVEVPDHRFDIPSSIPNENVWFSRFRFLKVDDGSTATLTCVGWPSYGDQPSCYYFVNDLGAIQQKDVKEPFDS